MSNTYKRGLIFCTFFVSCAAIALILAAFGTKHWIEGNAKRSRNPLESDGRIHFGLFNGKKELNVAYGWRSFDIDVLNQMKYEPEFLNYWYWFGAVSTLCLALIFTILSAILAVINTVTTAYKRFTKLSGLTLWNFFTFFCSLCSIGFWLALFYTKIQYNILSREDKSNEWTSDGMAELGYSFWFVVGAACAAFVNMILLIIASSEKETETIIPVLEEKSSGAIMLY